MVLRIIAVAILIGIVFYYQKRRFEEKPTELQKEVEELQKRPGLMRPAPTPVPSFPGLPPSGTPPLSTPAP